MNAEFAAHVITAEANMGTPEIVVMIHDTETGEGLPIATYPLGDNDNAADILWENDWRVLNAPVAWVDAGYSVMAVEPADDGFTIDGMDPEDWLYAMTM